MIGRRAWLMLPSHGPRPLSERAREALLLAPALPFLGILFGGIYAVPAIWLSRGRDPWLSVLLLSGLALTVFGAGFLLPISTGHLGWVYLVVAVAFFVVRRAFGDLGRNLEHFGGVHLPALGLGTAAAWYVILEVFAFRWAPASGVVLATLGAGAVVTLGIGLLGSLPLLAVRPASALRRL